MTTEQTEQRKVKRTCRVIRPETREPCGRAYYVEKGSKSQGCPQCCPRLISV